MPPVQVPGESTVCRNSSSSRALTETPHPSIGTIFDLVQFNARRWGESPCFGTRKLIKVHKETVSNNGGDVTAEKENLFWELGPYEYQSYDTVAREGLELGSGLRKIGLSKGDRVSIYAETSYKFQTFVA